MTDVPEFDGNGVRQATPPPPDAHQMMITLDARGLNVTGIPQNTIIAMGMLAVAQKVVMDVAGKTQESAVRPVSPIIRLQ